MIISPPFLPAIDPDDEAFIRNAMPDPSDTAPGSGGAPLGSYPLTTALTWHNGLHIRAPRDAQTSPQYLPARAVADGTVIFKREPRTATTDATDPQNYNPFGSTAAWTDNGIVIVRHKTDIGATGTTATSVTYYSVYMHLSSIEATVIEGRPIWRKDTIGSAGRIYGQQHQLHFEICLSEAELKKLVGANRAISWTDPAAAPTADGRTDAVFGSIYVYLPAGTPTSTGATAPTSHLRRIAPTRGTSAATDQFPPDTLRTAQWVEIGYHAGAAITRSYRATAGGADGQIGDAIGQPHPEPDYENNLYTEANRRHGSLGAAVRATSSPSGWYELLRFGRNLGSDPLPGNAAHWRKIPTDTGTVWADLNADGTFKFSDADFPAFLGWQCFDDDTSHNNQRCDSAQLKKVLRDPKAPETAKERVALAARLGDSKVRDKLRRAICKFPTEWDKKTIVDRYDWLLVDEEFKIGPGKEWDDYKAHCESVTFDDLPAEYKAADWHIHPRVFVSHMRKCGWLSANEIKRIYSSTDLSVIREYVVHFNRMSRKYLFNNYKYLSHLLGQGAIESAYLNSMQERAMFGPVVNGKVMGTTINPASAVNERAYGHWWGAANGEMVDWFSNTQVNSKGKVICSSYDNRMGNKGRPDGQKFRGRGFKQLTGRDNYVLYWRFRGWISGKSDLVGNPEIVATEPHNCMDSGGWYLTFLRPGVKQKIQSDIDHLALTPSDKSTEATVSLAVTMAINGGDIGKDRRLDETRNAKKILMDS